MQTIESDGRSQSTQHPIENDRGFQDAKHLMGEVGVAFDGHCYRYKEYRYDLLSDALTYAQLDQAKSSYRAEAYVQPQWLVREQPTEAQRQQMEELGITFNGRCYEFYGFRYDQLANAVNYVKMRL